MNKGFDWAILELKKGEKVARSGWNGKKQYIQLARVISFKTANGDAIFPHHMNIGSQAIVFFGTSGHQVGWLASQADMLADDWGYYDENM